MKKLLFLDVDGVLNSCDWFKSDEGKKREFVEEWRETHIDPKAIDRLNRIVFETQCCIVLSSTWRRGNSLGSTLRVFRKKGLTEKTWSAFIGMTPIMDGLSSGGVHTAPIRGDEIAEWLKQHPKSEGANICILDDDGDMGALMEHLILTNGNDGLTDEIADKVIAKLNNAVILVSP